MMGKHYSSRWGRFWIDGHFMAEIKSLAGHGEWDRLEALMGFMAQVFIVRANDMPYRDGVEYMGISRHFEELAEVEAVPTYDIEFQRVRTCNACQGTDWGPDDAMVATEIICQGCGAPTEFSNFVDHLKAVRRLP